MWIKAIRVMSYKSFVDSGDIEFQSGFNVIVGQNNAGKSALAQAISLKFSNAPHKSLETSPRRSLYLSKESNVDTQFEMTFDELIDWLPRDNKQFYFPLPDDDPTSKGHWLIQIINKNIKPDTTLKMQFHIDSNGNSTLKEIDGFFTAGTSQYRALSIHYDETSHSYIGGNIKNQNYSALFPSSLFSSFRSRIYKFDAERLNVTQSKRGSQSNLQANASNLPEVLHYLYNTSRHKYDEYERAVKIVFPHITAIRTPPKNEEIEIRIWSIDESTNRNDLTFTLEDSGTGIGQVLAMLYVVINSDFPRTIIIDEPQSFLHPGALRKLFDIFREYSHHQYIITTHSPTAVMAANPETIVMLKRENMISTAHKIDAKKNSELQLYLAEIGAKLSDVFGADNILWVEGPTEEQCFPKILSHFNFSLYGTKIVGVLHTGDFEGKHKNMVSRIYNKLSEAQGILPPAVGFVFDREGRTDTEIKDIIRLDEGRIHFLPCKLYENYIIHPEAICYVMNSIESFSESNIKAKQIETWINEHKWGKDYYVRQPTDNQKEDSDFYLKRVHGVKLLHDTFNHFADNPFDYKGSKVYYAVKLTEWILENDEEHLRTVFDTLVKIIGRENRTA